MKTYSESQTRKIIIIIIIITIIIIIIIILKYGPFRWELKLQYPGYKVSQHNITMDVLGGYSKDVRKSIKCLIGDRCDLVLKQMQKAMLSCTLNIARNFKILEH